MWETWVQSLSWEEPLQEGMTAQSSALAWRSPWTEEPGGCSPRGRRVRHDWHYCTDKGAKAQRLNNLLKETERTSSWVWNLSCSKACVLPAFYSAEYPFGSFERLFLSWQNSSSAVPEWTDFCNLVPETWWNRAPAQCLGSEHRLQWETTCALSLLSYFPVLCKGTWQLQRHRSPPKPFVTVYTFTVWHADSHWHLNSDTKGRERRRATGIICEAQGASRPFGGLRSANCPDAKELTHG